MLQTIVLSYAAISQQLLSDRFKEDETTLASRKISRRKLSIDRCEHPVLLRVF